MHFAQRPERCFAHQTGQAYWHVQTRVIRLLLDQHLQQNFLTDNFTHLLDSCPYSQKIVVRRFEIFLTCFLLCVFDNFRLLASQLALDVQPSHKNKSFREIWSNVIIVCKQSRNPEDDGQGAISAARGFNSNAGFAYDLKIAYSLLRTTPLEFFLINFYFINANSLRVFCKPKSKKRLTFA